MSGESIREMLQSQPFQPYDVHLSSGAVSEDRPKKKATLKARVNKKNKTNS